ncbi:hypothetical protein [Protaetiibacter larvae]|uniref:Uncharacterized protein n=1 Tax=Protaetiibacter larvae TaxID=2592654 RepID=A0A5C1Y8P4_9MICO|nr:hypothetical protein [Protaetiibacter larvae]QEO09539.1 hypothetical protein FLP23_05655 [Protaetiibacter larvae]
MQQLDPELDRMLAAARPADPAHDTAVRIELDGLVAQAIPRARTPRGRRRLMLGAGIGVLSLLSFGVGTAFADGSSGSGDHDVFGASLTVVSADDGRVLCSIVFEEGTTVPLDDAEIGPLENGESTTFSVRMDDLGEVNPSDSTLRVFVVDPASGKSTQLSCE